MFKLRLDQRTLLFMNLGLCAVGILLALLCFRVLREAQDILNQARQIDRAAGAMVDQMVNPRDPLM